MKKLIVWILLVALCPSFTFADPIKGFDLKPPAKKGKLLDAPFWLMSGALTVSTVYDGESTFYALGACHGTCHEINAFMAPHVANGRADFYATAMAINIVVMG